MAAIHTDPCPTPAARAAARFSARAAAVFLVGLAFLGMVISGAAIFFAPSGRAAAALDWSALGLARLQWEQLHLTMAVVFLGAGVWHIWLHWPVIGNLLWSGAAQTLCHRRELALAVGLVAFAVLASVLSLPPANWLEAAQAWFRHAAW